MSCKIKYNSDKTISQVYTQFGLESKLYNDISRIPVVQTKEEALDIYKSLFDKTDLMSSQKEPELIIRSSNGSGNHVSYRDALKSGENFELGVYDTDGKFLSLINVVSNFDQSTKEGLINEFIKEGLLEEYKSEYNGEMFFKPRGNNFVQKEINSLIISRDTRSNLGPNSYYNKQGLISINNISLDESDNEASKVLETLSKGLLGVNPFNIDNTTSQNKISEIELKRKLLDFLNDIGVKIMPISDYIENFKIKNGVEPSVKALADISNKIIAFKNENINLEDLTEETMHFIVESLDQKDTENILRNIHRTEEYREYSEHYRKLYSKKYQENDLELILRKEILGKVLRNSVLNLTSENNSNFYKKALDFIKSFFNNIIGDSKVDTLNEINSLVEKYIIQESRDGINLNNLKNSKFTLYSSGDNTLGIYVSNNQVLLDRLLQAKTNKLEAATLRGLKEQLEYQEEVGNLEDSLKQTLAFKKLLEVTKSKANHLEKAVVQATENQTELQLEDQNIQVELREVSNLLASQLDIINKMNYGDGGLNLNSENEKKLLIRKVDELISQINRAIGSYDNVVSETISRIADEIISTNSKLNETDRKFIIDSGKNMMKDSSQLMSTFGQIMYASNPVLNLTSHVISKMRDKEQVRTQKSFRKFAAGLEELGVTPKDLSEMNLNGYMEDYIDWNEFDLMVQESEYSVYNSVTDLNLSFDEYSEKKKNGNLPRLSNEQSEIYREKLRVRKNELRELPMKDGYYEQFQTKLDDLKISTITRTALSQISSTRAQIHNEAKNSNEKGLMIMTPVQKDTLQSLATQRKSLKNIYDSLGTLKKGLVVVDKDGLRDDVEYAQVGGETVVLESGIDIYSDEYKDAVIAFDLNRLDSSYEKQDKNREQAKNNFINEFNSIIDQYGSEKAKEFLETNLGVGFSDKYWENQSFESLLDNEIILSNPRNVDKIAKIKSLTNKKNSIIRLYGDISNPIEIQGNEMPESDKQAVLELIDQIDQLKDELEGYSEVKKNSNFQFNDDTFKGANRAYFRHIEDLGLELNSKDEILELTNHMSTKARSYFNSLLNEAEKIDKGIPSTSNNKLSLLENVKELNGLQSYSNAALVLGRRMMLPYFQETSTVAYQNTDNLFNSISELDAESKKLAVESWMESLYNDPNYQLNIHHTFEGEKVGEDINENYNTDFEAGRYQPKLSNPEVANRVINKDFVRKYEPVVEKGSVISVTKNNNKFLARQLYLDLHRENLNDIGEKGSINIFKLPQVSKTNTDKIISLLTKEDKKSTFKELLSDAFKYKVDDLVEGEGLESIEAKIIPKFFIRDLEVKSDVSDDIYYSAFMMTQQSKLYKARKEAMGDIAALENKMLSQKYAGDKSAEASNNYKMFKSYVDYNFFGKKEARHLKTTLPIFGEVDVTKILRVISDYVRSLNLGANPIVAGTSAITAEVQSTIERVLGERLNNSSMRLASKEFKKLAPEMMASNNVFGYNDKSKLNVLMEYMGQSEMSNKVQNAKYGKIARFMPKVLMAVHQLGNFPIIPRVVLSKLMDYRLVNGEIINEKEFLQNSDNSKADWKELEKNRLYSYLTPSEEGVSVDPKLYDSLKGGEDQFEKDILRIKKDTAETVQLIDTQIPEGQRTAAQRDFLFNFVTMHRSFLTIGMTRRFKSYQLNMDSGIYEEGSYLTAKNAIVDFTNSLADHKNMILAFKEAFNDPLGLRRKGLLEEGKENELKEYLTKLGRSTDVNVEIDLRRRNLRRLGIETAFMGGLVLLATLLKAMADDPDNEDIYALQLSNYLMLRLTNETASNQLGIATEINSVIKAPVMGMQQLGKASQIWNVFDDTEITRGHFKGLSKSDKYWISTLPGAKGFYDALNPRTKAESYEFYTKDNIDLASLKLFSLLNE